MEELIQFAEAKQLPPETCARLYKHVEFQVFHFQSACYMSHNFQMLVAQSAMALLPIFILLI